ncbi:hypothetical protein GCM10017779_33730 [Streptomyces capillispiralis]|uniref:Uncharacterized protein n=1 Tax=Streptomyces capillispiralis TaxID=68182 RepID=A0A561TAP0_9ACTN|nr:hypothetical protein FHX78_111122 [Streptomyces capillispiralis]GHH92916.1 hypothetical protein GCM10017779_33730 [Streptomyces capillispiralis]
MHDQEDPRTNVAPNGGPKHDGAVPAPPLGFLAERTKGSDRALVLA